MLVSKAIWSLSATGLMCCLFSCATYNQQASGFYSSFVKGDYVNATKRLDHNKLLHRHRNQLLYLLEKGRTEHLLEHFENSNRYFEAADLLMENGHQTVGNLASSLLINPMMQFYRGEAFEKYMVHYYKAMNYPQMNKTDDALVEARRINLRLQAQEDVEKKQHYSEDAFSMMMQGLIYEYADDYNNAFIAYRNATEAFLKNNGLFYGTPMPLQLKKDLIRMADMCGFYDEQAQYKKLFSLEESEKETFDDGELILFWENGLAPVKKQRDLIFYLRKDGSGNFYFTDSREFYHFPFDFANEANERMVNEVQSFRVSIPVYEPQPILFADAEVFLDDKKFCLESAQSINELAIQTLEERKLKELGNVLARMAVKRIAEQAARPNEDEKDPKKKSRKEVISLGIKLYSFASEKADTRNWQSLPNSIYYTRVPLHKGSNQISIDIKGINGLSKNFKFSLEGDGSRYFRNICTF